MSKSMLMGRWVLSLNLNKALTVDEVEGAKCRELVANVW